MSEKCDCGVPFCKQCFPVPPSNTMRVYIAGPMRGRPQYNFQAFDKAKAEVENAAHIAVSPASMDRAIWGFDGYGELTKGMTPRSVIAFDLTVLATCDAIYMLRGWEDSKGATAELAFAMAIGLKILYEDGAQESVINWSGKDRA